MKLPKARTANLLEQNFEKETLIYDLVIDKAFNLNETSTIVYKACNGITTFDEFKRRHNFSDDFVYLALDELKRNNLLTDEDYVSPFAATNRRDVIKKVGLATMFALPIITGLVAPKAINAASNSGGAAPVATNDFGKGCSLHNHCKFWCTQGRCCAVITSGNELINPGQTLASGPVSYGFQHFPPGTDPTSTCAEHFTCCDGYSTPSGTYEYSVIPEDEYGGPNPQEGGWTGYYSTYSCSCP